jgi:hypothetical protein
MIESGLDDQAREEHIAGLASVAGALAGQLQAAVDISSSDPEVRRMGTDAVSYFHIWHGALSSDRLLLKDRSLKSLMVARVPTAQSNRSAFDDAVIFAAKIQDFHPLLDAESHFSNQQRVRARVGHVKDRLGTLWMSMLGMPQCFQRTEVANVGSYFRNVYELESRIERATPYIPIWYYELELVDLELTVQSRIASCDGT